MNWQPIETAPRHQQVLIKLSDSDIPAVGYIDGNGDAWIGGEPFSNATHWMPK